MKNSETTETETRAEASKSAVEPVVMRQDLIDRVIKQRDEILQIFSDVEHWNSTHTIFEQIDPDPDGELKRMLAGLEKCLEKEGA